MDCSCCMSLQNGVEILAIIDAVLGIVNLGLCTLCILYLPDYYDGWTWSESEETYKYEKVSAQTFIIPIITSIFQILMAFMLRYVAKHRDYQNCRIWIIVTAIVVVLNTAILVCIWNDVLLTHLNTFFLGITAFPFCFKTFEIFMVYMFLRTLKKESQTDNGIIYSTVPTPTVPPPPPSDLAEQQPYATYDFPQPSCDQQNIYYPLQQPGPVVPPKQVNYSVITQQSENAYFVH